MARKEVAPVPTNRGQGSFRAGAPTPRSEPVCRQAVLLIHGIGEQEPMSTLRSFVLALVGNRDYRSKPDDLSRSFELRRLTSERKTSRVTDKGEPVEVTEKTCFFEYYWAFRLRDTTSRHIRGWAWRLLRASYGAVPKRLRKIWLVSWATLMLLGVTALLLVTLVVIRLITTAALWTEVETVLTIAAAGSLVLTVLAAVASAPMLYWVGDAARYLNPAPGNVAERQAIRRDGVKILHGLHRARDNGGPKYERILVIGHSLGSIIAYDLLRFYWAEVNERIPFEPGTEAFAALDKLRQAGDRRSGDPAGYRKAQDVLFASLPRDCPWRISDLVTLGSPMTYADILLASSGDELDDRTQQRELPTCPPVLDEDSDAYWFDNADGSRVLHHAAHFAVTKWTNLFFRGDALSGEIPSSFGWGVDNRLPGTFPVRHRRWERKLRSHTRYWPRSTADPVSDTVDALRKIIFRAKLGRSGERERDAPIS